MTPWVLRAERAQRAAPWVRDRRRIRALKGQVLPFAMILLRDRQFFLLPFQGAVTWVVRKPRVPFTSPPARFILPWAKFLLPLPGRSPPIAFPCGWFLRQQGQHRQHRQQGQHIWTSAPRIMIFTTIRTTKTTKLDEYAPKDDFYDN